MAERVVITGASRGLGLELTRQHAARGDRVLATCRRPAAAAGLSALAELWPGRIEIAPLDVTSEPSIEQGAAIAAERLGAVDLLWSNAGVYPGSPGIDVDEGPLASLEAKDGLAVLAVNAVGPLLVARAFLPLLRRGRDPKLAALSSGYGSLALNEGTPYWYGASKAALNMLHRSLAFDTEAGGVTILLMSPGWVRTDMGGPRAPTAVEESVAGMIRVALAAGPRQSGSFVDYRGDVVPW